MSFLGIKFTNPSAAAIAGAFIFGALGFSFSMGLASSGSLGKEEAATWALSFLGSAIILALGVSLENDRCRQLFSNLLILGILALLFATSVAVLIAV